MFNEIKNFFGSKSVETVDTSNEKMNELKGKMTGVSKELLYSIGTENLPDTTTNQETV